MVRDRSLENQNLSFDCESSKHNKSEFRAKIFLALNKSERLTVCVNRYYYDHAKRFPFHALSLEDNVEILHWPEVATEADILIRSFEQLLEEYGGNLLDSKSKDSGAFDSAIGFKVVFRNLHK